MDVIQDSIMSGTTAPDHSWQSKEKAEEALYARQKEREQLKGTSEKEETQETPEPALQVDRDFEGGYGGQEDLEDRYATTYGAH